MSIALGCIGDDYTGASDLANTLTKCGLRTIQLIGVPSEDLVLPDVDAVVISLKSRSIAAAQAVDWSRAADRWLRGRGAAHVIFKVCSTFDSTDAGNIGPVMDALRADSGDAIVLVTPAFPAVQRTVYKGNLFVGDVLLNESPLKDHPLNPMHDANLARVLARQSESKVGLVDLQTVAAGVDAVRDKLAELVDEGHGAAIIDAVFAADLKTIGAVAFEHRLSVGASGLGLGLATALVASGRAGMEKELSDGGAVGGPVAILAGSCSKATLEQIAEAEKAMPVLRLDTERLLSETHDSEVDRAIAWASGRLRESPVLVASSSAPEQVEQLQRRYGREASGQAIETAMASIAAALSQNGVRRLIVAGGETSGAVVDRLGLPGFEVGAEIAPGVPVLRSVGNGGEPTVMALKSGNFGGRDFFTKALDFVR